MDCCAWQELIRETALCFARLSERAPAAMKMIGHDQTRTHSHEPEPPQLTAQSSVGGSMFTPFNDAFLPKDLARAHSIPKAILSCPRQRVEAATSTRTVSPSVLEEEALATACSLGMSAIKEITELDTLGIPVYSSHCPNADDGLISYYAGKGVSATDARVSAAMEAIERTSASAKGRSFVHETYQDLKHQLGNRVVHPSELIIHSQLLPVEHVPLNWSWAFDLGSGESVLVPAIAVYHPYTESNGSPQLFVNNSNGLASGSNLLEAAIQGLYEVIERDALSLAKASGVFASVPKDTVTNSTCREYLELFAREGIQVSIKEMATDTVVPTFVALGNDTKRKNSYYLNAGLGTHASRDIALTRAIVELAQTRGTVLAGMREDLATFRDGNGTNDYDRILRRDRRWYSDIEPIVPYEDLATFRFSDALEELSWLVENIRAVCSRGPLLVNLTHPNSKLPVVRMIAPGLECYHRDDKRMGDRVAQARQIGLELGTIKEKSR
jgi:ribosomal protein S12 methylthiotransferase accessory factor